MKVLWRIVLALVLTGCGGKWVSADTQSAQDAVNLQLQVEAICGRADAGLGCDPRQVRALERGAYCASASMLFRHGQAFNNDAGIQCAPQ